jgi:predicted lipoprotein
MEIFKKAFTLTVTAALTLMLLPSCMIVRIDAGADTTEVTTISSGEKATDVNEYIDEKWESVLVPEIEERGAAMAEVLAASGDGWDAAGAEYGIKKGEIGAKYNFIVTGDAVVSQVDTTSKAGIIVLDLDAADAGDYTLNMAIGPVLKGTAIRDALENVNFNEFVNQMDYAKLASELNKFRNEQIAESVDFTSLQGKSVNFTGCFTQPADGAGEIDIMPVFLEVK